MMGKCIHKKKAHQLMVCLLGIFKEKNYLVYHAVELNKEAIIKLLMIAVTTLILSIVCAVFFTTRKTKS